MRVGGIVNLRRNGTLLRVKANVQIQGLTNKKEGVLGQDTVHGYKEIPQIPAFDTEITDALDTDLAELFSGTADTITCEVANGKVYALRDAWFAGEGTINSEEGNVTVRWEGLSVEEIR